MFLVERKDRAGDYRQLAVRFRTLAEAVQFPESRAELLWLTQSYQRLSQDTALARIVDVCRVLDTLDEVPGSLESRVPAEATLLLNL